MPRPAASRPLAVLLRAIAGQTRGATAVEYGLIVALIALSAVGGMSAIGHPVSDIFASINTSLTAVR
ncbi:Flp family type IVb pilin [Sphingomonas sp. 8AM]|uniref:Flp family type IVb pilin n=1 Tax=Sphingomonas sp. 8AM TaxID=2653170 RepID=UPI0012EF702C|nr:Flp family type IVb pilin [Sphingomonas sp. 8AM]VXC31137.1 Flp family type IVb pilin (modular protein) [Sphingomonas sp. 8AM]